MTAIGPWRAIQELADSIAALAERVAKLEQVDRLIEAYPPVTARNLSKPDKRKRVLTPEQKAELAARFKRGREAKKLQQETAP